MTDGIPLAKLQHFFAFYKPYRHRFGIIAGLRLAIAMRDWKRPTRQIFAVTVPGTPHPILLRAGTADRAVFEQILIHRELDFAMTRTPQLIVDAGAHIGLSSVSFAIRYPTARVLALEVDSSNFALLLENCRRYPSIVPLRTALWSRRAKVRISNPDAQPWSFHVEETSSDDPEGIDALGVSDLVEEHGHIDLLKMDIEGSERAVFSAGAERWIANVDQIAVELHDRLFRGCRHSLDRAVQGAGFHETSRGEYVILQRT